jgi:hypothetical protein
VHWRIPPAFIVESTGIIEVLEELHIWLAAPKVEICDLEIAPDWIRSVGIAEHKDINKRTMTSVIANSTVIREKAHRVIRSNEVGVLCHKFYNNAKKLKGGRDVGRGK